MNNKTEYDYSKLRGRIVEKCGTCSELSNKMGISRVILSRKMNGNTNFSTSDISTIVELLDIPVEEIGLYFFSPKV